MLTKSQIIREETVLTGGIAIESVSSPSAAQPTTSIASADQRIATSCKVYNGRGGSGM
jgi:hypothetical protein